MPSHDSNTGAKRARQAREALGIDPAAPLNDLLTTVEQVDPIYVSFNPSDRDVLAWRHNDATRKLIADGKLKVAITLSDKTAFPHTGVVSFVDQSLQSNTGTLLLRATVPNPEHILLPGQFVRVKPLGIKRDSALLVPQRAVTELQGAYRAAVVGGDNKVSIRPVTLGPQVGSMWIITDGLQPGETVVAVGTQKLTPGQVVSPKPYAGGDSAQQQ
jgi:membrane fusion protein (multidrug efflux system)